MNRQYTKHRMRQGTAKQRIVFLGVAWCLGGEDLVIFE
jgi:hypothetical protein